jgi:hypothetical protein
MSAHVLLPLDLAVNSKSERKVDLLPLLEFKPAALRTLAQFSDRSAKSYPPPIDVHRAARVSPNNKPIGPDLNREDSTICQALRPHWTSRRWSKHTHKAK